MIQKGIIMTTDVVIRYAKNIQKPNEIANFNRRYGITSSNIAAISWEKPHVSRRNYSVQLLKSMIAKLANGNDVKLFVMIELSAKQPKSAVVRHKKTWGLLSGDGLFSASIANKQDFLLDVGDGLVLSGIANIDIADDDVLRILLNRDDYVYFTLLKKDVPVFFPEGKLNRKSWVEFVWKNNGVVIFPMGYTDENTCEIVAMGHAYDISPLIN